jgi:hypothetical protein
MVHPKDANERLELLEMHVMSQVKDNPGLLMRVDRLEQFTKLLIGLAALGVAWKVLDIVGQVIAKVAVHP